MSTDIVVDNNGASYVNHDHIHLHKEEAEGNIEPNDILRFDCENRKSLLDHNSKLNPNSDFCFSISFVQKLLVKGTGTYFLMFALEVNLSNNGVVTFPGIALVWGLAVVIMVYSIGHISGSHLNPAVTIAFASCGRFPFKQVPAYISAQVLGSILAIATLRLIFEEGKQNDHHHLLEFIITFLLMFVVSGVATDNRVIGELAGLVIGCTTIVNILYTGPVLGCSMNPTRSLGPTMVYNRPTRRVIAGAWAYNLIRFRDKSSREIIKSGHFLGPLGI
ncbi:hypothetical protein MKX01_010967 [Papaver californicum]|nr:hypothetical protein MKX01_010967 [Papaver californicum]